MLLSKLYQARLRPTELGHRQSKTNRKEFIITEVPLIGTEEQAIIMHNLTSAIVSLPS